MNETYVECLVKGKPSMVMKFLKTLMIMLTVVFLLLGTATLLGLLIALVCGIVAYIIYLRADTEYEYLYVDREITIDRIMAKSKRKRVGKYELDKIEIIAPINSHRLDDYKNRQCKETDCSTGPAQPDTRYVMYTDGNNKVVFNPSPEFIKAIQNVAPRKVATY